MNVNFLDFVEFCIVFGEANEVEIGQKKVQRGYVGGVGLYAVGLGRFAVVKGRLRLLGLCVLEVLVAVVVVFATNQTKREQMWQETIKSIVNQTTVAEVDHGQQNADH